MINELLHILNARLRLRLAAVLAVSLLLSACSETPLPDGHDDELVELKLRVAPGFDVSTRANSVDVQNGEFDDDNDTEIGVFILDDDRNEFASASDGSFSSHSYLKYENLKYTYNSDGSLTLASGEGVNKDLSDRGMTAPMLVKGSRIVVIAYAPYDVGMTYDELVLTPKPTILLDQTDEAGIKASDFILGTPADNSFVFDGKPVSISMRHQLARMVLKFTPAGLLEIVNAGKSEAERITSMTASSMTVTALNAPKSTASAVSLDVAKENYVFPSDGFTLGEVEMAQYNNVVMSADNENELVATAIVLPYTYAIDNQPKFKIEYTVGGETKSITLKLRDLSQSITLGRGQSRTFKLKNPDSFTPGSNDENSVLDNLFVDDADGNKVDNNGEVW